VIMLANDSLYWVGSKFFTCSGLGWVGSGQSADGLGWVTQNGPVDNSGGTGPRSICFAVKCK